jgi:hypothetical protein
MAIHHKKDIPYISLENKKHQDEAIQDYAKGLRRYPQLEIKTGRGRKDKR